MNILHIKMMDRFKKYLVMVVIGTLLLHSWLPVYAIDAPTPPSAPETSSSTDPSSPPAPSAPSVPSSSSFEPSSEPSSPSAPKEDEAVSEETNSTNTTDSTQDSNAASPNTESSPTSAQPSTTPLGLPNTTNTGKMEDGKTGDTLITTGDATNSTVFLTTGNTNAAGDAKGQGDKTGSVAVGNVSNGVDSSNTASADVVNNTNTIQDNNASVDNTLAQTSTTGQNSTSYNVGNSKIVTGDANVSGTVITAVNTNVDGVAISEFNIVDDQKGDIILDFAANCISGCESSDTQVKNVGNGADSSNAAGVNELTNNSTFQTNDAAVGNNLTLTSHSGNNTASANTGGDSVIQTGDANVSANALTFVNNNLSGNVTYGVVNIFGNLVGDIVLPESEVSSSAAKNVGNGSNSTNSATVTEDTNNTTFQTNDAVIDNNLTLATTTGDNKASGNTSGDTFIQTGSSTVEAQTINVANSNVRGGTWWLVIVNEAGQWLGKILGVSDGSNFAGSQGTEFSVNNDGEITAVNSGNGASSDNTVSTTQTTNNTVVQNNNANIENNLHLTANTGGNKASYNTGGDAVIKTGDAKIVANLVNFVNNNITGGGKLLVTVVNVFGSWLGDFVTPGTSKPKNETAQNSSSNNALATTSLSDAPRVGGVNNLSSSQNNSNSSSTQNESSTNNTNSNSSNNTNSSILPSSNPTSYASTPVSASSQTLVAGASTTYNNVSLDGQIGNKSSNKTKSIKINLAWFVVLIPLVFAAVLLRKKLLLIKLPFRK